MIEGDDPLYNTALTIAILQSKEPSTSCSCWRNCRLRVKASTASANTLERFFNDKQAVPDFIMLHFVIGGRETSRTKVQQSPGLSMRVFERCVQHRCLFEQRSSSSAHSLHLGRQS